MIGKKLESPPLGWLKKGKHYTWDACITVRCDFQIPKHLWWDKIIEWNCMVISSTHFLQTSYKFCLNGHQQATTMSPSPLPHTSSLWAAHHLWLPSAALLNFIFPLDLCWLSLLHIWKLIHVIWSNKLLGGMTKMSRFHGCLRECPI